MRRGGPLHFLRGDHLGFTTLLTNQSQQAVALRWYRPYGEPRNALGDSPTDRLYTGQRWDSPLGLYDYRARYYHPALGRFVSADPVVAYRGTVSLQGEQGRQSKGQTQERATPGVARSAFRSDGGERPATVWRGRHHKVVTKRLHRAGCILQVRNGGLWRKMNLCSPHRTRALTESGLL